MTESIKKTYEEICIELDLLGADMLYAEVVKEETERHYRENPELLEPSIWNYNPVTHDIDFDDEGQPYVYEIVVPEKPQKAETETETKTETKCPGCYPIFQENQLGHVGPHGCLGDEY